MKLIKTLLIILAIVGIIAADTHTTNATGKLSTDGIWVSGTAPTDGDIIVVASGTICTVDVNIRLGSNASNIGHAFQVNGTNSSSYGKLVVNPGIKLTLQGNDRSSNTAGYTVKFGNFEPLAGCTVYVDAASDFETIILNNGIISATGTAESPVVFTGQSKWDNNSGTESKTGSAFNYDFDVNGLCIRNTTKPWIANSAGTGIGSMGNSSLSFSNKSPATILTTEVATLAEVNAAGEYFVNYHVGTIYYYNTNPTNSFDVAYKYLTFNGWGINSIEDDTYNEAKFDYCKFEYMGGDGARNYGLYNRYKKATSVQANRVFYLKNSTISFGKQFCAIRDVTGAAADMINVTGNTFNHCETVFFADVLGFTESATNSFINISNNVLNCKAFLNINEPYETSVSHKGIRIRKNTGNCANLVTSSWYCKMAQSYIDSNEIAAFGPIFDSRTLFDVGGKSTDSLLYIQDNSFSYGNRLMSPISYVQFQRNKLNTFLHHSIFGPVKDDVYSTDVTIVNNLAFNNTSGVNSSGFVETGYNHRAHLNNWKVLGNTIGRYLHALLSLGDTQDGGTYSLVTNLVVENNIAYEPNYGVLRNTNDADEFNQFHIASLDYNLVYAPVTAQCGNFKQQATFIKGGARYNLDTSRTVKGVVLFNPSYTLPYATSDSLVFTYTSDYNQTLGWSGGSGVQIYVDSGTCTSNSAHVEGSNSTNARAGTLTDAARSWSTDMTTGTVVRSKWVKITDGTGSGQIRAITNNTATVLTVVPSWTTLPQTGSKYVIVNSELRLLDDGTDSVSAGIYYPDLPTSSQTDAGITIESNLVTTDPKLDDATGTDVSDFYLGVTSPALDAGIANASLTTDYLNVERADPPDIGFYELDESCSAPTITGVVLVDTLGQSTSYDHTLGGGTCDSVKIVGTWPDSIVCAKTGANIGRITGIWKKRYTKAGYAIRAYGCDSATAYDSITIVGPVPSYSTSPVSMIKGNAYTQSVTIAGPSADSFAVSPTLPSGLSLTKATGAISGTPTAATVKAGYKVVAWLNGFRSDSTYDTITVVTSTFDSVGTANKNLKRSGTAKTFVTNLVDSNGNCKVYMGTTQIAPTKWSDGQVWWSIPSDMARGYYHPLIKNGSDTIANITTDSIRVRIPFAWLR